MERAGILVVGYDLPLRGTFVSCFVLYLALFCFCFFFGFISLLSPLLISNRRSPSAAQDLSLKDTGPKYEQTTVREVRVAGPSSWLGERGEVRTVWFQGCYELA